MTEEMKKAVDTLQQFNEALISLKSGVPEDCVDGLSDALDTVLRAVGGKGVFDEDDVV